MASPQVVTSMQQTMSGYTHTTVPMISSQQVQGSPYTRMFPGQLPGNGVHTAWHNYIVYSLGGAQQPTIVYPPQLQQHTQQHLDLQRPPPTQVYQSFQPPNRSHPSPQPGGYPMNQTMVPTARGPSGGKSPIVPSLHTSMKPGPSPQYPPPSTAKMPAAPMSYPPPPFSPISQFKSPPPPVQREFQAPSRSEHRTACFNKPEEVPGFVVRGDRKSKVRLSICFGLIMKIMFSRTLLKRRMRG